MLRRWLRRPHPPRPSGPDVAHLYSTLLGREATAAEVAAQRATGRSWQELVAAIVASDEYRRPRPTTAVRTDDAVVNIWHPDLARWGVPAGTWSTDHEAIMGRQGYIFLVRGTNSVADQYGRGFVLPPDWDERWATVLAVRHDEAAALGATLCAVVVPDKLSVLREHLADEITLEVEPPAARLAARHGVLYPVPALAAVAAGAYLRTDTHLSFDGNVALSRAVLSALDVGDDAVRAATSYGAERESYVTKGDLGTRFEPGVVEVVSTVSSWGSAEVLEDNRADVAAVGKHVGSRRVLRNASAPDRRTVVVFGDSYAFPQAYYHGISWHLAQHFGEVHTVWVPFGWDPAYVAGVGASVVVCETAERFVPRPPAVRTDVPQLLAAAVVAD